jgi:hypothetical protein
VTVCRANVFDVAGRKYQVVEVTVAVARVSRRRASGVKRVPDHAPVPDDADEAVAPVGFSLHGSTVRSALMPYLKNANSPVGCFAGNASTS